MPTSSKKELHEVSATLDPPKLLEEMRAVQAYLAALPDGEMPTSTTPSKPPDLAAFVASLSSAWHVGDVRPTFSIEAKPRYLRCLQRVPSKVPSAKPSAAPAPAALSERTGPQTKTTERPKPVYAEPGRARIQALRMAWSIACRRLKEFPSISAAQLFDELCIQVPGRFTRKQYKTLARRVSQERHAA